MVRRRGRRRRRLEEKFISKRPRVTVKKSLFFFPEFFNGTQNSFIYSLSLSLSLVFFRFVCDDWQRTWISPGKQQIP